MVALGAALGRVLEPGAVVFLEGDLGMGKTTLARGVMRHFGHKGAVKSPTYTLVEPYEFSNVTVYHFDLYRLGDPEELEYMGIRDYFGAAGFGAAGIALVEWSARGQGYLPLADLSVNISVLGKGRRLVFEAGTQRGVECLRRMPNSPKE